MVGVSLCVSEYVPPTKHIYCSLFFVWESSRVIMREITRQRRQVCPVIARCHFTFVTFVTNCHLWQACFAKVAFSHQNLKLPLTWQLQWDKRRCISCTDVTFLSSCLPLTLVIGFTFDCGSETWFSVACLCLSVLKFDISAAEGMSLWHLSAEASPSLSSPSPTLPPPAYWHSTALHFFTAACPTVLSLTAGLPACPGVWQAWARSTTPCPTTLLSASPAKTLLSYISIWPSAGVPVTQHWFQGPAPTKHQPVSPSADHTGR